MRIFSKSLFNLLYNSVDVLPLAVRLVSSANMLAVVDFKQFGKSFTYSRNNIGPRLEPCGTPQETVRHFDVVWLTLHICFLFVKYDLNQFKVLPTQPNFFNFSIKIAWSTQSNAFFKSRNIMLF